MLSFTEIGIWGIIISAGFLGGLFSFYLESILKNEKNHFSITNNSNNKIWAKQ